MQRVQVQFTEDEVQALRARASRSRRPMAAIVRDAVDAWMAADDRHARRDRALAAIGGCRSGLGDLADHHDRYLDELER